MLEGCRGAVGQSCKKKQNGYDLSTNGGKGFIFRREREQREGPRPPRTTSAAGMEPCWVLLAQKAASDASGAAGGVPSHHYHLLLWQRQPYPQGSCSTLLPSWWALTGWLHDLLV